MLNGPKPPSSMAGLPQRLQSPRRMFGGSRYFLNAMFSSSFIETFLARMMVTSENGLPVKAWQILQWQMKRAAGAALTSKWQAPHSHAARWGDDKVLVICRYSPQYEAAPDLAVRFRVQTSSNIRVRVRINWRLIANSGHQR